MSGPLPLKETTTLDTSWEREFGLVQGVKASGLVFLSGQMSIDENGVVVGKGTWKRRCDRPIPMSKKCCNNSISP